jgi:hypothetical protein
MGARITPSYQTLGFSMDPASNPVAASLAFTFNVQEPDRRPGKPLGSA